MTVVVEFRHRADLRVHLGDVGGMPRSVPNGKVWSDDEVLGTLALSKGTIDWWPKNAKRPIRLRWEQFARLMEDR